MKSSLQIRAERASLIFKETARKPVVIEFAGVPKAGKTTTLNTLQTFLKRCGFRSEVVVERASVCPIRDKKHANFNVWTACTALAHILEKTQDPPHSNDPHIIILDRGIFDSICWLMMMERLARILKSDREIIEKFLRIDDWKRRITGVIVMTALPKDAMEREKGYLPVIDAAGSIMNQEVLQLMLDTTREIAIRLKNDFRIYTVDTSSGDTKNNPKRTAEVVADIVLNLIEEQLQEDILCLPKSTVTNIFKDRQCLHAKEASSLLKLFNESGTFLSRQEVEQNKELLQALPVVIIRNKSGNVLQLRRREKLTNNILDKEIVIWAGGHVRKEDASNGSALIRCALRELQEELRLSVASHELNFIGAIYADVGTSTSKHVALVYEWNAETDDVDVVLSSVEFFERRGTSLSGSFIGLHDLANAVDTNKISEVWSSEIVREFLAKESFKFKPRLF